MFKETAITSTGVATGFSHAAAHYEQWAFPQQRIARNLTSRLSGQISDPAQIASILDIGCGTGYLTGLLAANYLTAAIQGLDHAAGMIAHCQERFKTNPRLAFCLEDIHSFRPAFSYDLITSSCTFQWLENVGQVVGRLNPFLKAGGYWALAIPVNGSFHELFTAYLSVLGRPFSASVLHEKESYLAAFNTAGFKLSLVHTEPLIVYFDQAEDVLRYFKKTGAYFKYQPGYKPLAFKEVKELLLYYKKHYRDSKGRIPVTYQVLYLLAKKIV